MNKIKLSFDSIIIIIVAIGICIFLVINFINKSELSKNSYSNINEVKADKAIKRGWIPSVIPNSAYDIYEEHNIDNNCPYGKFSYLEKDEEPFIASLNYKNGRYFKDNLEFKINKEENTVEFSFLTNNEKESITREKNLFDIFIIIFGIFSILYALLYSPILFYKSIKSGIENGWKSKGVKNTMFHVEFPIIVLLFSMFIFASGIYLFNDMFFRFINIVIEYFK